MKILALLCSLLLTIPIELNSQSISEIQLTDFFNLTFKDYFAQRKDSSTHDYYLLKDSIPTNVMTDYQNFKLHLVDYPQSYSLIKKKKISSLYWARMKQINRDTIDIVIGGWTVDFDRVFRIQKVDGKRKLVLRNYNFAAWDGAPIGYIPESRFIYDPNNKIWKRLSSKFLIEERFKKMRNE
jgi:hypothetical protein